MAGYGSAALSAYDLYNTASALGSAASTGATAGAAGAAAGTSAAAEGGSAAAAGAGSAAASTFGQYVPVLGMLLSAYMDSQAPAYTLNPSWYKQVNSALSAGPGPTADKSSPNYFGNQAQQQQAYNYFAALGSVQGEKGYENLTLSTPASSVPYSTGTYSGGPGGKSRSARKA